VKENEKMEGRKDLLILRAAALGQPEPHNSRRGGSERNSRGVRSFMREKCRETNMESKRNAQREKRKRRKKTGRDKVVLGIKTSKLEVEDGQ